MRVVGIQIEGPFVRIAVLEKDRKDLKFKHIKTFPLTEMQNVKELYIPSRPYRIASGVASSKTLVREMEASLPKTRHMEEALLFQSETLTHFKAEEVFTIPQIFSHERGKIKALLHTTPKNAINKCLTEFEALGIDPDGLSTVPLSLLSFARYSYPEIENAFLIHLGFQEWTCIWIEKGRLKKVHAFSGGIESLLSALWEDRKKTLLYKEVAGIAKQIDLLQLKSHLNPHLSSKLKEMRQELTKTIFSFHRQSGTIPYLFVGCIETFVHFQQFLTETIKEVLSTEISGKASLEELKHAVPIGWALEQLQTPLQLRREEFFPKKNWKKMGVYALWLITTSLLFSGAILLSSKWSIAKRLSKMTRELGVSLDSIDPTFKQQLFVQGPPEKGASSLISTTISEPLQKWMQVMETHEKECPYICKAPEVSEVLNWLSSHPLLNKLQQEGTPIVMQDLRYTLVQYPKIGSLEEPYRAKIEMEFRSHSPLDARKFHQALLKEERWIDTKEEIEWETLSDHYRTIFYLKNKPTGKSSHVD